MVNIYHILQRVYYDARVMFLMSGEVYNTHRASTFSIFTFSMHFECNL